MSPLEPSDREMPQQPTSSASPDLKVLLCFALLGSLIAWVVMCSFYPFYTIYTPVPNTAPAARGPRELDKDEAFLWNMRLGYGVYGLAVGACLGVGYVLPRRSIGCIILGLVTCGVLGGASGVAGGEAANSFFTSMGRTAETNAVLQAMVGQGLAWGLCGLGIGLGLGLFSKSWTQFFYRLAGGTISGLLAGGLHAPIHTAIFAENDFSLRLPDGAGAQFIWLTLPALMAAMVVGGLKVPALGKGE